MMSDAFSSRLSIHPNNSATTSAVLNTTATSLNAGGGGHPVGTTTSGGVSSGGTMSASNSSSSGSTTNDDHYPWDYWRATTKNLQSRIESNLHSVSSLLAEIEAQHRQDQQQKKINKNTHSIVVPNAALTSGAVTTGQFSGTRRGGGTGADTTTSSSSGSSSESSGVRWAALQNKRDTIQTDLQQSRSALNNLRLKAQNEAQKAQLQRFVDIFHSLSSDFILTARNVDEQ
eukprot:Lankesteria_metandrocarpae@DN3826_c0_g1_i2.p1